jgi:maltose O-acetyltransferase
VTINEIVTNIDLGWFAKEKINYFMRWYLKAFVFSLVRLLARNMIVPEVRIVLFRLTGIRIGKDVMINMDTRFIDEFTSGMIKIDEGAAIGPNVTFVANSYANKSFIREVYELDAVGKIHIKEGAWIGTGAVIQPGVTIGKGAIVGSNAVVTRDVEDFSIMVGVPARKIGDVREKQKK